ncbi:ATPase, T2SS/T4P/T4SS family [Oleidesulfovibrio sp.]|uniref:CpaF family protein n=1 Tax=Oleidesulfovibrio sp. TaxID=2909707 RepID=UPI003A859F38
MRLAERLMRSTRRKPVTPEVASQREEEALEMAFRRSSESFDAEQEEDNAAAPISAVRSPLSHRINIDNFEEQEEPEGQAGRTLQEVPEEQVTADASTAPPAEFPAESLTESPEEQIFAETSSQQVSEHKNSYAAAPRLQPEEASSIMSEGTLLAESPANVTSPAYNVENLPQIALRKNPPFVDVAQTAGMLTAAHEEIPGKEEAAEPTPARQASSVRNFMRGQQPKAAPKQASEAAPAQSYGEESYYEARARIHARLLEMMDISVAEHLPPERMAAEISRLVEKILRDEYRQAPLNAQERKRVVEEIKHEIMGLGPLEPLLADPTISDILVNNYKQVYVERGGKLHKANIRFHDDDHLRQIIDRIVSRIGRRVDESSPMVDARLADGSRVNAIIPPLALDGPSLSIRRFSKDPLELDDLIKFNALTPEIGEVLRGIVKARLNIIVSGGTGSGKTTMLNCLSRFVPHDERIVTIEDAAELQLKQDHVVRLETRPANIEGHGEVNARDLVKNCLRMRPDRIIVGEVRSAEVLDMLQAMNTGHDGSLTTIHANTPRDCLMRLETMVAMSGLNIGTLSLKRYITSAVDVIIQVSRLSDGSRKMTSLMEITGMEGEAVTMQEIFFFHQTGVDENGKVIGRFKSGGIRPKFATRLAAAGIQLDGSLFEKDMD